MTELTQTFVYFGNENEHGPVSVFPGETVADGDYSVQSYKVGTTPTESYTVVVPHALLAEGRLHEAAEVLLIAPGCTPAHALMEDGCDCHAKNMASRLAVEGTVIQVSVENWGGEYPPSRKAWLHVMGLLTLLGLELPQILAMIEDSSSSLQESFRLSSVL